MGETVANFDCVELVDGNFFTVQGDRFPSGSVIAFPSHGPDSEGTIDHNGTRLSKHARSDLGLEGGFYRGSTVRHRNYTFPLDVVERVASPSKDRDTVFDTLDDEEKALYEQIEPITEEYGADLAIMGSRLLGFHHDRSDLDLLVAGNDIDFDAIYRDVRKIDGLVPKELGLEHVADRDVMPDEVALHHANTPPTHLYWEEKDRDVHLIPSQEPGTWTDFYLPEEDDESTYLELEGEVIDASRSLYMPRSYTVATDNGELELLTYHWIYEGSFTEGDTIYLQGDLFPGEDAVYLRDSDHFAAPADLVG